MKKTDKDIKKELEEIAPSLAKLKDTGPDFTVPKDYFQNLTDDILSKIGREAATGSKQEKRPPGLWEQISAWMATLFKPQFAMGLAAGVLLMIAAFFVFQTEISNKESVVVQGDLTEAEIADYVALHIDDFDAELLIGLFDDLDDPAIYPSIELEDQELEEAVEDVLNEMDLQDLEELL